jgi:hypothetical protein
MRVQIFLYFFFMQAFLGSSQVEIAGSVKDSLGNPLGSLNVLIYPKNSAVLSTFGFTDDNGEFKIIVNLDTDSLDILVSSIHYKKERYTLSNKSQRLDITLSKDVKLLETINVKAKPIDWVGDTLSYLIEHFKGKEDISIEDILKKLPGIEVEENGRILYQGIPINKFYVEGMDLTDGSYSMISKNLPHETVTTVEVFENHQPIRILEDRVPSMQAAINIKLKKKLAYTGTGKMATGFAPWLWDINLTPMLLSKGIQMLASYQTNNTGNDVSMQLRQLISENDLAYPSAPMLGIRMFKPGSVGQYGAIDQPRYLDNKIHIGNLNALIPLKKDLELRAIVNYVDDIRENEIAVKKSFFLPDDSLFVLETHKRLQKIRHWKSSIDLKKNTKRIYLSNTTKFEFVEDTFRDTIINSANPVLIDQQIQAPATLFSNTLNTIFRAGEYLIEFKSLIQYENGPQKMSVVPGRFENVVNNNQEYDESIQNASSDRLYIDTYVGSNLSWKRWVYSVRAGVALRLQQLNSQLLLKQTENVVDPGPEFQNDLKSEQYQYYVVPAADYEINRLRFSFSLPMNLQRLNVHDHLTSSALSISKMLFAPSLNMRYRFKGFWDLRSSWSFHQRLNDPDDFYFSYILKNYIELIKREALFQETNRQTIGLSLFYKNPITTFFNTFSYKLIQRKTNLLNSSQLQEDGSTVILAMELPNKSFTHFFELKSSKYITAIKSSISLKFDYMTFFSNTIVNEELIDSRTSNYKISPEIYYYITSWLNLSYLFQFDVLNQYINNELRNQTTMQKHFINMNIFPTNQQTISVNFEHYLYNMINTTFLDLIYRYSIGKPKFDIELRWNNILNRSLYVDRINTQYLVAEYAQVLRPSQVLLGVRFTF